MNERDYSSLVSKRTFQLNLRIRYSKTTSFMYDKRYYQSLKKRMDEGETGSL